jgi:copper(I)-binding protein
MPKGEQMAQLSRPFQIALAAVLLFAVVWFVALNGHGSSSGSTPAASTPAPTPASTPSAHPAPGSTHIEGMTRAVAHAREAVAASQRTSEKSANSSAETPSEGAGSQGTSVTKSSTTVTTKHGAAHTSTTVVTKHGATGATVTTKHVVTPAPHKVASGGIPPRQAAIESELKRGEMAVVLFWNKKGADDNIVHEELQALLAAHHEIHAIGHTQEVHKLLKAVGLELEKRIAVHYASAEQVASFGTFTKTVQVYGTPTILVINKRGAVTTINGLTDAFAIEQTIDEARQES